MSGRAGTAIFWLYILELANGHLYAGYARDVRRRYAEHLRGRGARATRISAPRRLAACWRLRCTVGEALRLEARVKGGGRRLKKALVDNPAALRPLVRRAGLTVRVSVVEPAAIEAACRAEPGAVPGRTTRPTRSRPA